MEKNYKSRLQEINTFCFDVDGVFTDNIVYLGSDGEQMRTANVRDGYAVQLAVKKGLRIIILSGGKGEAIRRRFEGLGVTEIHLGVSSKAPRFKEILAGSGLNATDVCYMGDDIPDLAVMGHAGLACCPSDAVPEIKAIATYISPYAGGRGCVRDVLEQALKLKGLWMDGDAMLW
ncbi:MAG: HAD hydrolase family protein [Flavobacteriales bacterium]|nr:HAD hydrolase family protein [Flavobacteriales bacterium]